MDPKCNDECPKGREGVTDTEAHRGEGRAKTEAETGVMSPQAKKCREPPEAGASGGSFSPAAFGGSMALQTP